MEKLAITMDNDTTINFKEAIKKLADIPNEKINSFSKLAVKKNYRKNEYFSSIEKPSANLGYIAKGLVRVYIIDRDGNEVTLNFRGDNNFTSSYGGIILNNLQPVYIQTLEDSEIYIISRNEFIKIWETDAKWKDILQIITEYDSLELREREFSFLLYDAKTRYLNFIEKFSLFADRIKLKYVSSYLGISQETLSRIRSAPLLCSSKNLKN